MQQTARSGCIVLIILVSANGCNMRLKLADSAMYREDYAAACPIYEQEATRGNAEAQNNVGTCYYYGLGGYPVDMDAGQRWWIQAARQGDCVARNNLFANGIMWHRLFEVPPSDMPTK